MAAFQLQIGGFEDAFRMAKLQAEVAGLQFLGASVDLWLADLQIEIDKLLEETRKDEDDGQRTQHGNGIDELI